MSKIIACVALMFVSGCGPSVSEKKFFDAALAGNTPYEVPGVTGYEIRSYEIVQKLDNLVVVRLTYGTKLGTDLVETKKFKINKEHRLVATDQKDIIKAIRSNLMTIAAVVDQVLLENPDGPERLEKLKWMNMVKQAPTISNISPVNGEDYSSLAITFQPNNTDYKLSVFDADGNHASFTWNEK